ncbi:acyltransferase family protein [Thalassotalea sediminis]|uniref:acyltransferase family protein n=1 Tax=Thalassotalea sediminis TaxID=1759089 RepID=UPI0025739FE1|nr:acyltransferase family protein [Thalassotalea sediminis]
MPTRRLDLDWLRIVLFGLLILHHIGMFYVANWGFHAKSQYRYEWLESLMLLVEPWRMPAIWIISGIAIRFVLAKVSIVRFVSLRTLRLLLPLAFGIFIIVPPQLFIEMTANGDISMNYWQFMQAFYNEQSTIFENYQAGIWPHIDVNHLWYLRSLWYYSLYLVILLPLLNSKLLVAIKTWLGNSHGIFTISLLIILVFSIQLIWITGETRYPIGFLFLLLGYLLGWQRTFWRKLHLNLTPLSVCYIIISMCFLVLYNVYYLEIIKGRSIPLVFEVLSLFLYSAMRVFGVLLILSLGYCFLRTRSSKLTYFNEAVYPLYILHQTVILLVGYYLTQLSLGGAIEALILIMSTVIVCFALFEVIRRVDIIRPFFGLKMQKQYQKNTRFLGYCAGILLVSPLVLQLIF